MKGHTVDLSHSIKRKRGKNLQNFRSLVPDPLTRKNNQFWNCGDIETRFERDISMHILSVHSIFNPDHTSLIYSGMLHQSFLYILRTNIGSIVNDDLFSATTEPEIAIIIKTHCVTGIEPTLLNDLCCSGEIIPISDRQSGRLNPEHILLTNTQLSSIG